MTMIDDLTLMAFVDGELPPQRRTEVEAAMESDPALRARAAGFRSARTAARAAYTIAPDPRDTALAALIGGPATRMSPSPVERIKTWLSGVTLPQLATAGGLATACFVAGITLGSFGSNDQGFSLDRQGAVADAGLIRVLDTRAAADGPDAEGRGVGLTFRSVQGDWCRTFQAAQDGVAGLACRRDGRWQAQVVAPFDASTGDLRTASSETPAAVLNVVDALIGGETLDAGAERTVISGGWN